jgi:TrbL/VirB6 plasmid conjugal transfer protein
VKTRPIALATLALLGAGAGPARGAPAAVHKAPSSPPLVSGEAGAGDAVAEEGAGETPQTQVDPLVSNGLGSPTCRGALASELAATNRRNCETSGFVAAPAPTGDYGIDVHINTGLFGLGTGGGLSFVQDLIITPLWMALVWSVHALVVMLEWCFTIDLLDGGTAVGVGRGLRAMQAAFTEPWLPIALATASVLILYHGLIRRRVADTLGEALLMGAMMVAGIWVITDPTGTVGALGEWANEASLGTLAVTSRGTPAGAGGALGRSLEGIFSSAIEAPWCYLEFGNVAWCREPSRLDPSLRSAALKIAAREIAQTACQPSSALLGECTVPSSAQAKALEHSAELLREARTNGAIFLALPANGPARNSINEQGSLLRTLCQSSEATNCRGPTAAQAEFRTDGGTWPRLGGLLLIAAGLLGMLLLLGFVALRLLAAAIFSLLYLLLAPAMVLAPAFGETGRALFRRWAAQLLGAVVSKLVFSFLLGAMFAVLAILSGLNALGWWTQWLLMSAFWWGAYTRRHHALGAAGGALAGHAGAGEHASRRSIARRVSEVFETPRRGIAAARWAKARLSRPAPEGQARKLARVGRERARAGTDAQVIRTLEGEHRDASAQARDAPNVNRRLDDGRAQLERIGRERADALALGDTRRAAELGHRGDRVKGEIERGQQELSRARRVASAGDRALRGTGQAHTREQREERDRFLDAQAALPASARARRASERRDYAAMSQLAGYGREEYERLDPRRQRAARLEIDRELALRRELTETARSFSEDVPRVGRRERRRADMKFDGALQRRMRAGGHGMPASRTERTALDSWLAAGRAEGRSTPDRQGGEPESSVMRDAREVAARRKRQLGRDRP